MKLNFKIVKNNVTLIIICSLVLRFLYLYFVEGIKLNVGEDDEDYFHIASYVEQNGLLNWKFHNRPPLISLIIIPIIKFTNDYYSLILIKSLMISFSVFTCVILYFLALELFKNRRMALITSMIYCFYPYSIFISTRLYTENLGALLVTSISLFLIKFLNKYENKYLIIASFMMGLLSLTRSSYFYLPFVISLLILFINAKIKKKIFLIIKIFFIFFITLSPWIIKNYIQLNEFVPTTTRLGYGLWLSNNDFSSNLIRRGGYERTHKFHQEILFSKKFGPVEQSNYLKEKALEEIKNNKYEFMKAIMFRFVNFFNPKPNPYQNFKFKDLAMIIYFSPILIIFLVGLTRHDYNLEKILLFTIILYSLLTHLPFYGFPRFRFPVDSLIFLFSISFLFEKIKSKSFLKFLSKLKFFRE